MMASSSFLVRTILALFALVSIHCTSALDDYVCSTDEDCQGGDPSGSCESSSRCSFSDTGCAGGRRYASESGDLSDLCVDEAEGDTPNPDDLPDPSSDLPDPDIDPDATSMRLSIGLFNQTPEVQQIKVIIDNTVYAVCDAVTVSQCDIDIAKGLAVTILPRSEEGLSVFTTDCGQGPDCQSPTCSFEAAENCSVEAVYQGF